MPLRLHWSSDSTRGAGRSATEFVHSAPATERQTPVPKSLRGLPAAALTVTLLGTLGGVTLAAGPSAAQPQPDQPAASAAAPASLAALDTDGDSLPDTWETNGYDANGDGVIDVDLPALGADPQHKDLFVEMDYMAGRIP